MAPLPSRAPLARARLAPLARATRLALSAAALGLAFVACAGEAEFSASGGPAVASVTSGLTIHGCKCPSSGSCSKISYADIPADGQYIVTSFGGGSDTQGMSCGGLADGTWAYIADSARFGCGAKVKIEANGKSCIAQVADCGPNRCVEEAAANVGGPPGQCGAHKPIIDASPYITGYLFGSKDFGYVDQVKVKATVVDKSTPIGCPGGKAPAKPGDDGADYQEGCQNDTECHHNTPGVGVVCDPAANGAGESACVDGCKQDAECPQGETCSSNDKKTLGSCSGQSPKVGTPCKTDAECSGGKAGSGRICSTDTKTCIVGCHADTDCPGGSTNGNTKCDHSTKPWSCVTRKNLGDPCTADKDCHGGVGGTQRICGANKVCVDECRSDWDCQSTERCDKSKTPQKCSYDAKPGVSDSCVITYPSGVALQGIKTPASVKSEYSTRGCNAPFKCMIDVRDIKDANTGKPLSYNHVMLSKNFGLRQLTATSAAKSPYVYVDPELVVHLEMTRAGYGKPISINSGFRSAAHQAATCKSMCGKPSCTSNGSVTCALCSRHMSGSAVDTQHSSPKCALAGKACNPGKFDFIYNEAAGGDHLHIEMKPIHPPKCVYKDIYCK